MRQRARAVTAARPSFRPSRHGFAFDNSWPQAPALIVRTPVGRIGIGNAARGLCGGMVFGALDFWRADHEPPADRPPPGAPLYRYIVRRLLQSWHPPAGVVRYYLDMLADDGRLAERTIAQRWPAVRALLDQGQPAPLGVVTVGAASPLLLGHNHQVVAYAYGQAGAEVTLRVYDPNSGPDDAVAIRFSTAAPAAGFAHNLAIGWPVRGFFLTSYKPAAPPAG